MFSYHYSTSVADSTLSSYKTSSYSSSAYSTYGVPSGIDYFANLYTGLTTSSSSYSSSTTTNYYDNWTTSTETCDFGVTSSSQSSSSYTSYYGSVRYEAGSTTHSSNSTHTISGASSTISTSSSDTSFTGPCGYSYYTVITSENSSNFGTSSTYGYTTTTHNAGGTHTVSESFVSVSLINSSNTSYTERCDFGDPITQSSSSSSTIGIYTYYSSFTTSHGYYGIHTVTLSSVVATSASTTLSTSFNAVTDFTTPTSYVHYARTTATSYLYTTYAGYTTVLMVGTSGTTITNDIMSLRTSAYYGDTRTNYVSGTYSLNVLRGDSTGYYLNIVRQTETGTSSANVYVSQSGTSTASSNLSSSSIGSTVSSSTQNYFYSTSEDETYWDTAYPDYTKFYTYTVFTDGGPVNVSNSTMFSLSGTTSATTETSSTAPAYGTTSSSTQAVSITTSGAAYFSNTITVGTYTSSKWTTSTATSLDTTISSFTGTTTRSAHYYVDPFPSSTSVSRTFNDFVIYLRSNGEVLYVHTNTDLQSKILGSAGFTATSFDDSYYSYLNTYSYFGPLTSLGTTYTDATASVAWTATSRFTKGIWTTGKAAMSVLPDASSVYAGIGQALDRKGVSGNKDVSVFGLVQYGNKSAEMITQNDGAYELTVGTSQQTISYYSPTVYQAMNSNPYRWHPMITVMNTTGGGYTSPYAFTTSSTITML